MRYRKVVYCILTGLFLVLCSTGCSLRAANIGSNRPAEVIGDEPIEMEVLHLMSGSKFEYVWDEERRETIASSEYSMIEIDECCMEKYPKVGPVLNALNQAIAAETEEAYDDVRMRAESDSTAVFGLKQDLCVRRADSMVLSLVDRTVYYENGINVKSDNRGISLDAKTGRILELQEVVTDINVLPELVKKQIEKYEIGNMDVDGYFSGGQVSWVLDYHGITFFLPLSSDTVTATLSFDEFPDVVKNAYKRVPDSYGVELSLDDIFYYDLDCDGQMDEFSVSGIMNIDYYTYEKQRIIWNENRYELESYSYDIDPVFIHSAAGKNFLYIKNTGDSDWQTINIFSFENGALYNKGTVNFGWHTVTKDDETREKILTDPDEFTLDTRTDMLSTVNGYKKFCVSSSGIPATAQQWYDLERIYELTIKYPVKGILVDENTGAELGEKILQAGDMVLYYRTDNETFADLKLKDGSVVRFMIDNSDWPRKVNGMDIEQVFEGMMFAG